MITSPTVFRQKKIVHFVVERDCIAMQGKIEDGFSILRPVLHDPYCMINISQGLNINA